MALFAIGDLHFSPKNSKPMDIFGWENHKEKIFDDWMAQVLPDDVVIIAGDISWAMKYEEAKENLDEINTLPGKKILLKGNHDFWWQSLAKMQRDYPDFFFLQNNCYMDDRYIVFGTRGWDLPGGKEFTEGDQKIFDREKGRLQLSLDACPADQQDRIRIVAMHYPPVLESAVGSDIIEMIQKNRIDHMIYGHLHGQESFRNILEGQRQGTDYHLVSADYLDFKLKKITE